MAAFRGLILRCALIALALVAVAVPSTPASHAQAFDCSGNDWIVASVAEFEAAASCWDDATVPGDYSITLAVDLNGSIEVRPRTLEYSLTIDGAGRTVHDGDVRIAGVFDGPAENHASPIVLREVTLRSSLPTGGLSITWASDVAVEDVSIFGGSNGIDVSHANATIVRAQVLGVAPMNPLAVERARVVLQDSVLENTDDQALYVAQSALIVRNSIIRDTAGLFAHGGESEILFDRSAILDNDVSLFAVVSSNCCPNSTISYLNSTFAQHDATAPFTVGIGAREGSLVQVANSTVLTNGEFGLIGPVQTRSSLVDRCDLPETFGQNQEDNFAWPPERFDQGPTDLGANVGGCFGTPNLHHHPLDDYGCAVPTPIGCVPTYATTTTNAARGTGQCAATIIPTPNDPFDIPLSDLQPGLASLLTTTGAQSLDGRGFARTACDAGSYESDGNEPTPSTGIRIATLDLNHPLANGELQLDYGELELANAIEDADIDVVLLQRVLKGPFGAQLPDQVIEELNRRGISMLYDYAPAYDSNPESPEVQLDFGGQLILSRFPMTERGAVTLPNPVADGLDTAIQWVLMDTPTETIRLVNVRGHDEAPCAFVQSLNEWLAEQPPLTTIVAGNLTADRPVGCIGELAAGWVDACATAVADASCARTVIEIVDAQLQDATNDYILHRPVSGSPVGLAQAQVLPQPPGIFSDHLAVVADYDFVGGTTDSDSDGVGDAGDNCPNVGNDFQRDVDGDGIGDGCDPVLDGDANCDDTRDIIDALVIAQYDAGVRTDAASCTIANPATELYAYGADANNDGTTDIIDALLMAQCSAAIQNFACPAIPEFD